MRWAFAFAVTGGLSATMAAGETFSITMPTLSAAQAPAAFEMSMPPLRAKVASEDFVVSLPAVRAKAAEAGFVMSMPNLVAKTAPNEFVVTMPTLVAAKADAPFAITMPTVVAIALGPEEAQEDGEDEATEDMAEAPTLQCEMLEQCFPAEDILTVETDLISFGYTPETYNRFCQDVAQSLGGCDAIASADPIPPIPGLGTTTGDGTAGFLGPIFNRCLPLEEYMIDLQRREDAGEDTEAEAERLMLRITAATTHLMNGRSDLYCEEVTAGLP
ncbi:MAG: hypothetical protein AAFP28_03635 [Pseudomonadota bacterium]